MTDHATLQASSWQSTSICFQLANIGSEVERTISWKKKGNREYSQKAFERALELLEFSRSAPLPFATQKELARIRELLVDWHLGTNEYGSTDASWQRYFHAFTFAVRNRT